MKMKWCGTRFLMFILCAGVQLHAQQAGGGQESFETTKAKAEKGDVTAQVILGVDYQVGKEVKQDYLEAVRWYRKAAEQNDAWAKCNLGICYELGQGVAKDEMEAVKWYRKAAEQNIAQAQYNLGICYYNGQGVEKDSAEAVRWFRKAVDQGYASAQYNLGFCYYNGEGVKKDSAEAVRWFRKAADQECAEAQYNLSVCYRAGNGVEKNLMEAASWSLKAAEQGLADAQMEIASYYGKGVGVPQNFVESLKWIILAAAQGDVDAVKVLPKLERSVTSEQISEAQRLAHAFKPKKHQESGSDNSILPNTSVASGSGFFITDDGYLISNHHVVKGAAKVRLVTSAGLIDAKVVRVDAANDLALLKADGKFTPLPVTSSRSVKLGGTVATVGFPNTGMQGFAPKFARGEIASLSGAADDARYFQISVPVQPGNSGGALVDVQGNVVGVVSAKLNASAALAASGALPENVNYAVKSSFLLSFLESVPDVASKLKEPNTKDEKFDEAVQSAQAAAVLVLVY